MKPVAHDCERCGENLASTADGLCAPCRNDERHRMASTIEDILNRKRVTS